MSPEFAYAARSVVYECTSGRHLQYFYHERLGTKNEKVGILQQHQTEEVFVQFEDQNKVSGLVPVLPHFLEEALCSLNFFASRIRI
jgi:hypothetical protein